MHLDTNGVPQNENYKNKTYEIKCTTVGYKSILQCIYLKYTLSTCIL